jgi:YopX protein.
MTIQLFPPYKVLFNDQVYSYLSHDDNFVSLTNGECLELSECKLLPYTGFQDCEDKPIYEGDVHVTFLHQYIAQGAVIEFVDGEYWAIPKKVVTSTGEIIDVASVSALDCSLPLNTFEKKDGLKISGNYWDTFLPVSNRCRQALQERQARKNDIEE